MTDRGTAARKIGGATVIDEMIERREGGGTATGEIGTGTTSGGRVVRHRREVLTETGATVLGGLRLLTSVAGMMSLMAGEGVPGTIVGILSVTLSLVLKGSSLCVLLLFHCSHVVLLSSFLSDKQALLTSTERHLVLHCGLLCAMELMSSFLGT